jgi:glycogen phosphorylase
MSTDLLLTKIPKRISGLYELSYNLWWSWNVEAREMFKELDRLLWMATNHNPVKLLQQIEPTKLIAAAQNPAFLKQYDEVMKDFRIDLSATRTWFMNKYPQMKDSTFAFFSLEFAIHNSLPLYAGGLGILTGDYCKEASDLGIPLVGIGFMYPQGYFHQHISQEGWQEETYEQLNFNESPIIPVFSPDGKRLKVEIQVDSRSIYVSVWQVNVGRVKLYLLDTNIDENNSSDRQLSARLYAGDREIRLLQEMLLGIGGVRVLRALHYDPRSWHSNEGHTSFMMLERIRELVAGGMDFDKAVDEVKNTTVFTTHTPVPAGNDAFSFDLMDKHFHRFRDLLKIDREKFLNLGKERADSPVFNMTVLGLKLAEHRNGVSQLHGSICRKMWHGLWPDKEENEVPITSVTNGVHITTWMAPQLQSLFDKYLGNDWIQKHDDPELWEKIKSIPAEELWEIRRWLKYKLDRAVEDRIRQRWTKDNIAPAQTLAMGSLIDSEILTLGFCRRFTEYKRASLLFHDVNRLKKILSSSMYPVQIIFSGKAHPDDMSGKYMIHEIYNAAKNSEFGGRVAFVENYDMHIARYLVYGVDVWLNNPKLFEEASGTSGMKAAANGVPQLSILDGWWHEGYNGSNGWAVPYDDNYLKMDQQAKNKADAESMYTLLEEKIIPLYYKRDLNGVPHDWVDLIKETIRSNIPMFSTRRMAKEYTESMYLKAMEYCTIFPQSQVCNEQKIDYSI